MNLKGAVGFELKIKWLREQVTKKLSRAHARMPMRSSDARALGPYRSVSPEGALRWGSSRSYAGFSGFLQVTLSGKETPRRPRTLPDSSDRLVPR